jgi:hypothetical protein
MKLRFLSILLVLGLLAASPAFALDLHEARNAGIVGETSTGYVAVLKETPEATALAADVNQKRLQEYTRISKENDQPVDIVAKLAAVKIINSLDSGDYYQDTQGNWLRR